MEVNNLTGPIVDCGVTVHRKMGPGLIESVYEACLEQELKKRNLKVKRQVSIPLVYDEVKLEEAFRVDLLVNKSVILELKVVDKVLPVHKAQLLSCLRLTRLHVVLLLNFHVPLMKDGVHRIVNDL